MQGEKTIPRKKYALSFIVVGAVLAVLGVILNFVLDPKATFDLPWFILGIGVIAVVSVSYTHLTLPTIRLV